MSASEPEVGDIVMVYGLKTGKVFHKFLSGTGEEVYGHQAYLWSV